MESIICLEIKEQDRRGWIEIIQVIESIGREGKAGKWPAVSV